MKEKRKKILLNSIVILSICFLFLFTFQVYQDYKYYSVYSKEELEEFFSLKDTLLWNLKQSRYIGVLVK
ncbi:MAG: hypothetical protein HFJ25_05040 [Clostridia bacterium]|nr:hypothetical protein [Clostridia bacterium]